MKGLALHSGLQPRKQGVELSIPFGRFLVQGQPHAPLDQIAIAQHRFGFMHQKYRTGIAAGPADSARPVVGVYASFGAADQSRSNIADAFQHPVEPRRHPGAPARQKFAERPSINLPEEIGALLDRRHRVHVENMHGDNPLCRFQKCIEIFAPKWSEN